MFPIASKKLSSECGDYAITFLGPFDKPQQMIPGASRHLAQAVAITQCSLVDAKLASVCKVVFYVTPAGGGPAGLIFIQTSVLFV